MEFLVYIENSDDFCQVENTCSIPMYNDPPSAWLHFGQKKDDNQAHLACWNCGVWKYEFAKMQKFVFVKG